MENAYQAVSNAPIPLGDALLFDMLDTNPEESKTIRGIFEEAPVLTSGHRTRLIKTCNTRAQLHGGNELLKEMARRSE